jgi:glutamine amidotransferase
LPGKKPFLGICVGMQLLADKGYEYGTHQGLGWIGGEVVPIVPKDKSLKIPHMGWNVVEFTKDKAHPVLHHQKKGAHFYFVHSFMFKCEDESHVYGMATYGGDVTSIVLKENIMGVQFHPEKSQEAGLQLLHDFLLWTP